MKGKQTFLLRGTFSLLLFMILGYTVKFYPDTITSVDASIQSVIRGNLPDYLTLFFKTITHLGDTITQIVLVVTVAGILYAWKKWKIESFWVLFCGTVAAVLISSLKLLYARERPGITHLLEAHGYSFPSGHATGAFLIFGSLWVICYQRMEKSYLRTMLLSFLALLIGLIGLSRIYVGVHYPSDVLAGFLLAYAVLNMAYPFYDQLRFEWRFSGKQS